jgi:hypothetical protein
VVANAAWLGPGAAAHSPPFFAGVNVPLSLNHTRVVSLTLEDGPDAFAQDAILDGLDREKATATFFLVGEVEWCPTFPARSSLPDLSRRSTDTGAPQPYAIAPPVCLQPISLERAVHVIGVYGRRARHWFATVHRHVPDVPGAPGQAEVVRF